MKSSYRVFISLIVSMGILQIGMQPAFADEPVPQVDFTNADFLKQWLFQFVGSNGFSPQGGVASSDELSSSNLQQLGAFTIASDPSKADNVADKMDAAGGVLSVVSLLPVIQTMSLAPMFALLPALAFIPIVGWIATIVGAILAVIGLGMSHKLSRTQKMRNAELMAWGKCLNGDGKLVNQILFGIKNNAQIVDAKTRGLVADSVQFAKDKYQIYLINQKIKALPTADQLAPRLVKSDSGVLQMMSGQDQLNLLLAKLRAKAVPFQASIDQYNFITFENKLNEVVGGAQKNCQKFCQLRAKYINYVTHVTRINSLIAADNAKGIDPELDPAVIKLANSIEVSMLKKINAMEDLIAKKEADLTTPGLSAIKTFQFNMELQALQKKKAGYVDGLNQVTVLSNGVLTPAQQADLAQFTQAGFTPEDANLVCDPNGVL